MVYPQRGFFSLVRRGSSLHDQAAQKEAQKEEGVTLSGRQLALCSMPEARKLLEYAQARKLCALPLGLVTSANGSALSVAIPYGKKTEIVPAVQFASGRLVQAIEVPYEILADAIHRAYCGEHGRIAIATEKLAATLPIEETDNLLNFRGSEAQVPRFLEALVDFAVAREASDIHLVPGSDGVRVRLRIDGILHSRDEPICSPKIYAQLVSRIKVLACLDHSQRHLPLDGSFSLEAGGRDVHVRVSTLPTIHGEKVVLRLLGARSCASLEELGMPRALISEIEQVILERSGAIVVCGAVSSGKSATLYGIVERLLRLQLNVATVEDPVEYRIDGISQTAVSQENGLTFVTALRALLRQDPDVLLIGEMRDSEAAEVAMQAAVTGHLVLTTLHCGSLRELEARLKSFKLQDSLSQSGIRLVIRQKLVPLLCDKCRVIDLRGSNQCGFTVYQQIGCVHCDYSGVGRRTLIAEGVTRDQNSALIPVAHPSLFEQLKELLKRGEISQQIFEREKYGIGKSKV